MPADRGYQDDHDPRSFESGPSRRIRIAAWTVALVALGAFGIVIWYAYNLGIRDGTESVAPLIRADARPTKIKPEKPGGMAVPHQDKEIYETLGSGGNTEPKVERLLPPPEQPKALPSPAPPAQAPSAPSSTSGGDQARGDQASGDQGGAPAPSDQLRALMEREGLTVEAEGAKTGAEKDRPTPPKADVATAPPPPPKQAPAATTPPAPPAAAPAPAAPTQTATTADMAGRWRIQLAAFRDRPTAESEWGRLQKRYPDLLGALALEVQQADLGAKGIFYRMRGGPIADEASAKLLCAQLKQRNQGCMVVRP